MEGTMAEIRMFGGNFAPRNWAYCNGQLLSIAQNSALFSLLGTTYGGDGRTTFALPDLRGRVPSGAGSGPGLSTIKLGQRSGIEYLNLGTLQMPSHNHSVLGDFNTHLTVLVSDNDGNDAKSPNNAFGKNVFDDDGSSTKGDFIYKKTPAFGSDQLRSDTVATTASVTIGSAGASQAVNNMAPWLAINYVICLQGVYPSRS